MYNEATVVSSTPPLFEEAIIRLDRIIAQLEYLREEHRTHIVRLISGPQPSPQSPPVNAPSPSVLPAALILRERLAQVEELASNLAVQASFYKDL